MDDCNLPTLTTGAGAGFVQIPLWTIVTRRTEDKTIALGVQIPLWTIVTIVDALDMAIQRCSDSSMDDCNRSLPGPGRPWFGVQIPLWTIVTWPARYGCCHPSGVQIPLWTIVTMQQYIVKGFFTVQIPLWTIVTAKGLVEEHYNQGSDSSMDDCNVD